MSFVKVLPRTTGHHAMPFPAGIVVAVLGASGGVGRTTTAANLAAAWAAFGRRVSAIDLCSSAPALADHLGLRVYQPRWEALSRGESPAVAMIPGGIEGVRVLPGPGPAERRIPDAVMVNGLVRLLAQARHQDDYVVLDTPADPFHPLTRAAFEQARVVVFVTDAAPAPVRQLSSAMASPWSGGSALRCLVVVRARPEIGRDAVAVAGELSVTPHLVIPDSPQIYWPSFAGSPVSLTETTDGRSWRRLAERIDALGPGKKRKEAS